MTNKEFKKLFTKGTTGKVFWGVLLFAFGTLLIYSGINALTNEKSEFIAKYGIVGLVIMLFIGICMIVFGFVFLFKVINTGILINSGKHKLLNAILSDDADYVLWMYPREEQTVNHSLWIHSNDGKYYVLDMNDLQHTVDGLKFLVSKFPDAILGDDKENEKIYKEKLKQYKTK